MERLKFWFDTQILKIREILAKMWPIILFLIFTVASCGIFVLLKRLSKPKPKGESHERKIDYLAPAFRIRWSDIKYDGPGSKFVRRIRRRMERNGKEASNKTVGPNR